MPDCSWFRSNPLAGCALAALAFACLAAPGAHADPRHEAVVRVASPVADRLLGGGSARRAALEVRTVSTETFGVGEALVHSYRARASVQLAPVSAGLAPYAGFGLGLQVVEGETAESVRGPGVGVGSIDVGTGANAFLGLRIPVGRASLYAEGRAGLANDLGRVQRDRLRIDGRGDYSGFAGVRWAF
ncbi:MAG: hypothetical protein ACQGVK_21550 [Myxococcota bacterium]